MKRIFRTLEIMFDKITNHDWDAPIIIAGDEGTGKSHLNLHLLEKWYSLKNQDVTPDLINHINLDLIQWSENLKNCEKYDMSVWDEGGELSNKRSMSKLNFIISRAFQIIRGDNLFCVMTIPSVFDLDGFFTKRRAKGLIQVYARGRFAFWSQDRLRRIIALNQNRMVKSVWIVKPTFYDTFPKYNGILLQPYNDKKKDYMKDTRDSLYNEILDMKHKESGGASDKERLVFAMKKELGAEKTAQIVGVTRRSIYNLCNSYVKKEGDKVNYSNGE